ncbi:hypothetical protein ACSER5_13685, partial [Pseudomonas aeruginosa]
MSPLLITALIIGGIALLIAIGYINHVVENSKLEKARLKAELNDRVRRCAQISESLPGQFVSPSLKLLMSQIELSLRIPRHSDTQPTLIRTPVPRSFG